jgi:hypothetical protein
MSGFLAEPMTSVEIAHDIDDSPAAGHEQNPSR